MIRITNNFVPFFVERTCDSLYNRPKRLPNKKNVKTFLIFQYCLNKWFVFSNILWVYLEIFNNHAYIPLTDKQIEFFLISYISWYFFVYYFLLNQCFQNKYIFKSAW